MKRASLLASLSLLSLLTAACRESNPMPPGNWTGRCPAADPKASTEFGLPPTSFVRDKAHIFTADFVAELERSLSIYQQETCHQLTVVTVGSLEGQPLESYALNYANRIGLGYRRLNNGLMLVIAPEIHQARIQIGCGLEDVISDARANEIMQNELLPTLAQSSWQQAVETSLKTLGALARKKTIAEEFRPAGCRKAAKTAQ